MKQALIIIALVSSYNGMAQSLASVNYMIEGKSFTGYYAYPSELNANTKTILIIHEWWGLNEYPKSRAMKIAGEGNIAFCIDMYGTGKQGLNPQEAQSLAMPFYENPQLAYQHFMAGYDAAVQLRGVDKNKMVAIGYCFGGSMVLNAAKMGAPVDAIVSFHGGLVGVPVEKDKLTASVLVCNGGADQFVPETDIDAIKLQMRANNEDFTLINYDGATHAFTNPKATDNGIKFNIPIAYNAEADAKSWIDFNKFIAEKVK